jgi:hypothetical protein
MGQGERTDLEHSANLPKVSQKDAAEMLNVGERSVRTAVKVSRDAPAPIVEAAKAGTVSGYKGPWSRFSGPA